MLLEDRRRAALTVGPTARWPRRVATPRRALRHTPAVLSPGHLATDWCGRFRRPGPSVEPRLLRTVEPRRAAGRSRHRGVRGEQAAPAPQSAAADHRRGARRPAKVCGGPAVHARRSSTGGRHAARKHPAHRGTVRPRRARAARSAALAITPQPRAVIWKLLMLRVVSSEWHSPNEARRASSVSNHPAAEKRCGRCGRPVHRGGISGLEQSSDVVRIPTTTGITKPAASPASARPWNPMAQAN